MFKSSMRWIRIFCAIAGSIFFFPVSCSMSGAASVIILSMMDQKDVQKGDLLHRTFAVVAEPGEEGRLFRVFYKSQIPSLATVNQEEKKASSFSFRMSAPKAYLQIDNVNFSYQVIEDTGHEQLIELVGSDANGDYTTWSRYKATKSAITPLSSRLMGPGHAVLGGVFGFIFASVLSLVVNIFRPFKK